MIRKSRATARLTKSTAKVTKVEVLVSFDRIGVRLIATMKPIVFAYTLIRPQLMLSPTPR